MKSTLVKVTLCLFALPAFADTTASTPDPVLDDAYYLACGKAQVAANTCVKKAKTTGTGVFEGWAAKMTSNSMGKTGADKAADQAASLLCKDKLEAADTACGAAK